MLEAGDVEASEPEETAGDAEPAESADKPAASEDKQ
jgi:hypothetical protein